MRLPPLRINLKQQRDLAVAVRALKVGQVVGMPTETVYGLAARMDSAAGIAQIFSLKQRPFFDPLIVHIGSRKMLSRVVSHWGKVEELLAATFWPGPLTIICRKNSKVSDLITSGLSTVGIRWPQNEVAQELIRRANCPLAAPSANKFGKTSPTQALHVREAFGKSVFVLEGGSSTVGIESTIVKADYVKKILHILRPGSISSENISACMQAIGGWNVETVDTQAQGIVAPGMLKEHYQPEIPLILFDEDTFSSSPECGWKLEDGIEMVLSPDPRIAARSLYSEMRSLAKGVIQSSAGQKVKPKFLYFTLTAKMQHPDWEGILDRLNRASSHRFLKNRNKFGSRNS